MKKFAILAALAATTLTAPAASLTWGYGGGYLYVSKPGDTQAVQAHLFDATEMQTFKDNGAAFVLVYLGTSSTLDVGSIVDTDVKDSIALDFEFDGDDSYATPMEKQFTVSEGTYAKDDYFGIAFYTGSGYTSIYAVTDYEDGTVGSALSPVVQITNMDPTSDFSLYASSGGPVDDYDINMAGVTVPEPSVALLGLLGLGMLLKRRRA